MKIKVKKKKKNFPEEDKKKMSKISRINRNSYFIRDNFKIQN